MGHEGGGWYGLHATPFAAPEQRKLVEERSAYLKEKYKQLHDRVLTIYQNDNFLLKRYIV